MHQRSSEGPLWLMYWGYKYKWCFIDIPHITAFHSCRILSKKLGGPLIISQAARQTIWCTRDHWRGHFDWQTGVTVRILHITAFHWLRILNTKLDGPLIISQTARCSFNAPEVIGQAALTDILRFHICMMYCWSLTYCKRPEVPFKALEIIAGAALTDALRLHIYCIWCTVRMMHIPAFHWCKVLKKKLGGFLIISQTANGPFNVPEIIRGAALTDVLMLQI